MGYNEVTGNVFVKRFATGLKGSINDRWSYDAIVGYQDSHQDLDVRTAVVRNLYAASDAVVHPTTGQIVCRSQWYNTANQFVAAGTGRDPGCVPLNIFGDGAASQAATDYVMGTSTGNANTNDVDIKQTTADVNFRGDLGERISLGAGPISVALGANYRKMTAERTVDALSAIYKDLTGIRGAPFNTTGTLGGYSYGVATPFTGEVSVKEGYLEFGVPLVRDRPGIQELSTTLAGRVTDYSQSGIVYMWKTGLNWNINDSVRIRGTVSADTRAPNVVELFNSAQISRGTYTAPWNRLVSLQGQNITTGNATLTPEDAKTYTVGFVVSPTSLPGFQASLDWYKINLLGSIEAPGGQDVIDRCFFGDQEYCSKLLINGQRVTTIAQTLTTADFIEATLANQNEETDVYTSGLDFEANYRMPLASGNLNLRLTGLYLLDDYNADNGCTAGALGKTSDLVGAIGACGANPKIRARLSANYTIGRFGINVQERYIHSGLRNPNYLTGVDISDNTVPAISYTDMTLKYGLPSLFGGAGEVYFNVTNLLDKDPPPTNSTAGRSWIDPTEQEVYDLLGRRFVLGMRLNW